MAVPKVKQDGTEEPDSPRVEGVAALERGLAVLEALGASDGPQPLAELARRTGLYKSTLLRLLASLERRGYTVRQADGRYRLGPTLPRLGAAYARGLDLRAALDPVLAALAAETRETAGFFVREGEGRLLLARVEGQQAVRDWITIGSLLPLQGAAGHTLTRFAGGWRGDEPLLDSSFGERTPEMAAISVPVFRAGGALAGALTVSGTCTRFRDPDHHAALSAALLRAGAALTRALDGEAMGFDSPKKVP
ncbi:IclR family transcriptional regulator [Pararoseomonas indoligenes]|uniref:IclR family transcriptional regulator n=1 Tax=Roseomonas indoligenes TaxID=2820811 RepID=A0A940N4W6_9PROT|nr:IclR family transcriptional regulator [Pararoseomonas indoligenes]MBP0495215.1 IclR family transcriptional regulator [Pararoseomonas indoligenes]